MSSSEILQKHSIVDPLNRKLEIDEQALKERITEKSRKEEIKTNIRIKAYNYGVGDLVFLKRQNISKGGELYYCPYEIIDLQEKGNIMQLDLENRIVWVNIKQLKPLINDEEMGEADVSCPK